MIADEPRTPRLAPSCFAGRGVNRVSGLAELVRILILRGGIAPGEMLVEVLLAERFRTSRSTLRERRCVCSRDAGSRSRERP